MTAYDKHDDDVMKPVQSPPEPLRLAIGTWFFKLLVGSSPGGLPADFFSYSAPAILICDEILCDSEAFESEMDFATGKRNRTQWLSSRLFRELKDAGILKPVPYRELAADLIEQHCSDGLATRVQEVMEENRLAIRTNPRAARSGIDPVLSQVNEIFLLELAARGLIPYGWREGHLPRARMTRTPVVRTVPGLHRSSSPDVLTAMAAALPHVTVLPTPKQLREVSPEAYAAYRANLARERVPLYLWMYDDPDWSRERYNALRLGSDFRSNDELVDRSRERAALTGMTALLNLRERATAERRALQQTLTLAMINGTPPHKLREEAREHEKRYQQLLPTTDRFAVGVVSTTAAVLTGLTSILVDSIIAGAVGGVVTLAGGAKVAKSRWQELQARKQEPLGWIHSEVHKIQR